MEFKIIIKELLFSGADRSLKTGDGMSCVQIVTNNAQYFSDTQLRSLMFCLEDQKQCICLMRHRPIKKMKRSPWVFLLGIAINLAIILIFYGFREQWDSGET